MGRKKQEPTYIKSIRVNEDIVTGKNDIEQLFNNWKMNYPGLNDWIGHGLNELEEGMKELIDKIR